MCSFFTVHVQAFSLLCPFLSLHELVQYWVSFKHTSLITMFSFTATKHLYAMFLFLTHVSLPGSAQCRWVTWLQGGEDGAKSTSMRRVVFAQTCLFSDEQQLRSELRREKQTKEQIQSCFHWYTNTEVGINTINIWIDPACEAHKEWWTAGYCHICLKITFVVWNKRHLQTYCWFTLQT